MPPSNTASLPNLLAAQKIFARLLTEISGILESAI